MELVGRDGINGHIRIILVLAQDSLLYIFAPYDIRSPLVKASFMALTSHCSRSDSAMSCQ
jgi:hypothetical protein